LDRIASRFPLGALRWTASMISTERAPTVENLARRNRAIFPRKAEQAASERLAACGFEVRGQLYVQRVP
jgi:hypothetical protein